MEGSQSAPVLSNEDYAIPKHGAGLTGHPKKVLLGTIAKDKGQYSSRINQIIKQAGKVVGPGHYIQHEPWDEGKTAHIIHAGNKFPNSLRDYKPCNKVPSSPTYEKKDIGMSVSIASGSHLSNRPRIIFGQVPKGKRRSFLEQAEAAGRRTPAPGHNDLSQRPDRNRLDLPVTKVLDWQKGTVKTVGKGTPEKEIAPNHYNPNWAPTEDIQPNYAVPKAKAQNFLDKAVKEKMMCKQSKKEMPGPGTYNVHTLDDSKFSRGTRYLQLRGMSRSAVSGYF